MDDRTNPTPSGKGSRTRAAPFTEETAKEAGKNGGKASGKVRRQKKELREFAQAILNARVGDPKINKRMENIGVTQTGKKPKVVDAILGNMAEMAMEKKPTSTEVALTLLKIASGEICGPPELRGGMASDENTAGVVVLPGVTEALTPPDEPEDVNSQTPGNSRA